ncbi:hypothetical protein LguiA_033175 [Lonicera macranthoides]
MGGKLVLLPKLVIIRGDHNTGKIKQDEVLIAGFERKGHAVGDIRGVKFKAVKVSGVSFLFIQREGGEAKPGDFPSISKWVRYNKFRKKPGSYVHFHLALMMRAGAEMDLSYSLEVHHHLSSHGRPPRTE